MSDSPDAHLQLKKRARRRLVGAFAFAGLAAVVLPMIMDDEPKQQVQDVQIRIPGQDQTPFTPKMAKPSAAMVASEKAAASEKAEAIQPPPAAPVAKPADVPASKTADKAVDKPPEKKSEKPAEKVVEKPTKSSASDPQRAAAILGGKADSASAKTDTPAGNGGGQYLILIGAYANPANVKQLQSKIGELGVKTFTEPLELPDGKKTTRVRAGPFPNREVADKALEKMKRIGVNGVVAAKQ